MRDGRARRSVDGDLWVWSKLPARDPLFPFAHALGVRYWLDVPGGGDRDSFAAGFAAAA